MEFFSFVVEMNFCSSPQAVLVKPPTVVKVMPKKNYIYYILMCEESGCQTSCSQF